MGTQIGNYEDQSAQRQDWQWDINQDYSQSYNYTLNNDSATQYLPPQDDILSAPFLLNNVGAPFLIGLAVGYFAKKVLKIALFIAGAAIVFLFVGEYFGMAQVSDSGLQSAANAAADAARQSGGFLTERLSHITSKGVSATAGFFVGLKIG